MILRIKRKYFKILIDHSSVQKVNDFCHKSSEMVSHFNFQKEDIECSVGNFVVSCGGTDDIYLYNC